jgi:hypothetical protein
VFLCGAKQSRRRDSLARYLRSHYNDVLVFYAEPVWALLASQSSGTNALDIEERLAKLADVIIIIVESPGTFAELGAFAISPVLRPKLLPLLEVQHKGEESFIETGPVRWIDTDSQFKPSIWMRHESILEAANDIRDRIDRVPTVKAGSVENLIESPKHLVFFVCDLIAVFGPCTATHVEYAASNILGEETGIDTMFYIGLAKAMQLINSFEHESTTLYYRPLVNNKLSSFQQRRRNLDILTLRTRMLAAMQRCEPCKPVLRELERIL